MHPLKTWFIFAINSSSICFRFMNIKYIIFSFLLQLTILLSLINQTTGQESNKNIRQIAQGILSETSAEEKLKLNAILLDSIKSQLSSNINNIESTDSSGLIFELISKNNRLQIITWAILFTDEWEYFGFIKSYNEVKQRFIVWELTPSDFKQSIGSKKPHTQRNWPAGVYLKLIETTYNKRNYFTLIGWLASDAQTAYKFIDMLIISKSGKPSFGKSAYFSMEKKYTNRILFSYNSQSNFQLDYGKYDYTEKSWNRKKKRYDQKVFTDNLIVFDRLIPLYPDLKDHPEFHVPAGNIIDAFVFEKGKWRIKQDIDARNMKLKDKGNDKEKPQMELFPSSSNSE